MWLRVLAALPEDLRLVPRTHVNQLLTTCNTGVRASDALLRLLQALSHVYTFVNTDTSYTN